MTAAAELRARVLTAVRLRSVLFKAGTGNRGNPEALRKWFNAGADGAIDWGSHGDFEQCVAVAGKYMDDPEGYCNRRHQDAVGGPPGSEGKAAEADDTSTVADARGKKVDAFAALLVALFAQLQRGSIDVDEYLVKVGDAFDTAIGSVPLDAQATIDQLRAKAIERAKGYAEPAQLDRDSEDAPSEDQKTNWGNIIAGSLWAASFAAVAFRDREEKQGPLKKRLDTAKAEAEDAEGKRKQELQDQIEAINAEIEQIVSSVLTWQTQGDPHVCEDCDALDGQTFMLEDVEFWPGEGDFGENTECGPNCRCTLD